MSRITVRSLLVSLIAAWLATATAAENLDGTWILRIKNPEHKEVSTLTIRFSEESARSCLGGSWKQVIVKAAQSTDKKFFPISDPLSYQLEGSKLTIGRNGVCDAYLHLSGTFDGTKAEGSYGTLGWGSSRRLGEFSLVRSQ